MSSTTPLRGLPKPTSTDTPDVVRDIGNLATALDTNVPILCTSTTHPASPVQGETVWETDTKRLVTFDGAAWQTLADPYMNLRCKLTSSTDPVAATGTNVVFPLDTVVYDNGAAIAGTAMADTANNGIRIRVAGYYVLTARVPWPSNATGFRLTWINDATVSGAQAEDYRMAVSGSATISTFSSEPIFLPVNELITLNGTQNSGASLTLAAQNGRRHYLAARYVGS